jgi:AmiR/NasT family two-component response regulator
LERENAQLREALASRILIEQAKGVLAERFRIDVGQAFEVLRRSARARRRRLHEVAAEVVAGPARSRGRVEVPAAGASHG